MSGGYTGRMGFVDLSTGEVREEQLDENLARDFIGGHGLGVRILYECQKGGVNPLGPENKNSSLFPNLVTMTSTG